MLNHFARAFWPSVYLLFSFPNLQVPFLLPVEHSPELFQSVSPVELCFGWQVLFRVWYSEWGCCVQMRADRSGATYCLPLIWILCCCSFLWLWPRSCWYIWYIMLLSLWYIPLTHCVWSFNWETYLILSKMFGGILFVFLSVFHFIKDLLFMLSLLIFLYSFFNQF